MSRMELDSLIVPVQFKGTGEPVKREMDRAFMTAAVPVSPAGRRARKYERWSASNVMGFLGPGTEHVRSRILWSVIDLSDGQQGDDFYGAPAVAVRSTWWRRGRSACPGTLSYKSPPWSNTSPMNGPEAVRDMRQFQRGGTLFPRSTESESDLRDGFVSPEDALEVPFEKDPVWTLWDRGDLDAPPAMKQRKEAFVAGTRTLTIVADSRENPSAGLP
ncbi:uncharacterized protein N7482_006848 [Penicillium canariense]|uniref:Uncharacterized protein n=1 Tax=Penicillium canariense TaxID=189055 RepID=A0A9W9LJJ4_9EURO|nr:uncharacterized protein N7482_006848 [Penicillium canariense]KAJ5159844.1 hypothetical protein N7482_006848 [Penicillium canariense]